MQVWSEKNPSGRRIYKRVIGTVLEYSDEAAVRQAAVGIFVRVEYAVQL